MSATLATPLAEVQALAARCAEAGDAEVSKDFEQRFGVTPEAFVQMDAQAQQQAMHLQQQATHKDAKNAIIWGGLPQGNVEATTPIAATHADEHAALSAVASRSMQTKELIGEPLDWAVARGLGRAYQARTEYDGIGMEYPPDRFSTDGGQGIEILEREGICINKVGEGVWRASYYRAKIKADGSGRSFMSAEGPTPLVAAMRSFCVARLGDCVDVPVGLISDIADVKKSVSKDDLPSPGM